MSTRRTSGFAAVEAVAVALVIASQGSRRLGRLGQDLAQLRQIGAATGQYAADNSDLFATFSWRRGQVYQAQYPDLNNASTDLDAAANQLVYLLRTRANRPLMPVVPAFVPHLQYSLTVLEVYMDQALPNRLGISAEDRNRPLWAADPLGYDQGLYTPNLGTSVAPSSSWRHPYGASFRTMLAFVDASPVGARLSSGGNTSTLFSNSNSVLAGQPLTSVAYPSQKVMMADYIARHFGPRQVYCATNEARLPVLMAEGSVQVKAATDANTGCDPNTGQAYTSITYSPTAIDPPVIGSNSFAAGRFIWTRKMLRGRDFGGVEVPGF